MSRGYLTPYTTYVFTDKDPIIDKVRTVVQDTEESLAHISERSGVSLGTLYNWFNGPTRRPQFASLMAVVRACGADIEIVYPKRKK